MLDHVSITVSDMARSAPFYAAVMDALGHPCVRRESGALGFGIRNSAIDDTHTYLSVIGIRAPVHADARHWCFRTETRACVDAFHAAGLTHGGVSDGAPGLRPNYHEAYYAAFLLDPDGNRIEAVCHRGEA